MRALEKSDFMLPVGSGSDAGGVDEPEGVASEKLFPADGVGATQQDQIIHADISTAKLQANLAKQQAERVGQPSGCIEEWLPPCSSDVTARAAARQSCQVGLDGSSDELRDIVEQRRLAVKQLRTDCAARAERSRELRARLRDVEDARRQVNRPIARLRAELESDCCSAGRTAMQGEDRRASLLQSLGGVGAKVSRLRQEAAEGRVRFHALQTAYEVAPDDAMLRTLWERRQPLESLRAHSERQQRRSAALLADLRRTLDLVLRVHVEAGGGPAAKLDIDHALRTDVLSQLGLSKAGGAQLAGLVDKYTRCLAPRRAASPEPLAAEATSIAAAAAARGDGRSSLSSVSSSRSEVHTPPAAGAAASSGDSIGRPPPGGGGGEAPSASFREEARLLRQRLAEEMRRVAATLGEEGGRAEREVLRAAAWGDCETLAVCLPQAEGAAVPGVADPDPGLHGWTAWHAAAAHGQPAAVEALEDFCGERGMEVQSAYGQRTTAGLMPLSIACLQGHAEVVRALLEGMAPVDVRDARGNTPVLWSMASNKAHSTAEILELLLNAQADPSAANFSGQQVELPGAFGMNSVPASTRQGRPSPPLSASTSTSSLPRASAGSGSGNFAGRRGSGGRGTTARGGGWAEEEEEEDEEEEAEEAFRYISSSSSAWLGRQSLLTQAVSRLAPPIRDAAGFMQRLEAREEAQLEPEEEDAGVWSSEAKNYTHAGLAAVFGGADPKKKRSHAARREDGAQTLVLTCDRILLFDAPKWSLRLSLPLAELREVLASPRCGTIFVIRPGGQPDILLDCPARDRFLDELHLALARGGWGGRDAKQVARVITEPIVELLDGSRGAVGVLACPLAESDGFLLLPRSPSLLLAGGGSGRDCSAFGFLELRRRTQPRAAGAGVCWRWQRYFFILRHSMVGDAGDGELVLVWCHHPNAAQAAGSVPLANVRHVRPADPSAASGGDLVFIVEHLPGGPGADTLPPLMLRARSAAIREAWMETLHAAGAARG